MVLLILDIAFDHNLIQPDSRSIITSAPEAALGYFLRLLFKPERGFPLENTHDVSDGILGRDAEVQMDMIITDVLSIKLQALSLADLFEYSE